MAVVIAPELDARRGSFRRLLACLVSAAGLLLLPGTWSTRAATLAVCRPSVSAAADRAALPLGETLGLSVNLAPGCTGTPERRHLELVLQPTGDAAADRQLGLALADMVDGLPADFGGIGVVSGDGLTPDGQIMELAPTTDRAKVRAALLAFGGGGGPSQPLHVLLNAARAVYLPAEPDLPKLVGRRHIVVIADASAPAGRDQTIDIEAKAADEDAIELLRYCLGSACPNLPWAENAVVAGVAPLVVDLTARLRRAALPALATFRLTAVYGPASAYVFQSARPPSSTMGWRYGQRAWPYIAWDFKDQRDEASLVWRLRPLERGAAVAALTHVVMEGITTSGESLVETIAVERFVDTETLAALPSACRLRAGVNAPDQVRLDDGFDLVLRLQAECPGGPQAADVVLVVDRSASMASGNRTRELNLGLQGFLTTVDLNLHRVALIDMQTDARLVASLGQDRATLLAAVAAARPAGETGLGKALDLARQVLEGRREKALPVTILLTDGQGSFPRPGADDPWARAGAWLQLEEVSTFVACLSGPQVCNPRLSAIASGPAWLRHTPRAAELEATLLELAGRLGQPSLRRVTLRHDLQGAFFDSAPNGVDDPIYLHQRGSGMQTVPQPLVGSLDLTSPVWARAVGRWPLTDAWEAVWVDSEGRVGAAAIPPVDVEVLAPSDEGPCRLIGGQRGADPAEPLLNDTVRAQSGGSLACEPAAQQLELLLVLDHSDSMRGQRILDLRSGVARLLAEAAAPGLRVGLVAFSDRVLTSRPLGTSPAAILAALEGADPGGITNIGLGLSAAGDLLDAARPGSRRLVFVLTDGRNSLGTDSMVAAADQLKDSEQNEIAALCLAASCDPALETIVSRQGYYGDLSDSAELAGFFSRLAAAVDGRAPISADLRDQTGAALEAVPGEAVPPADFAPDPLVWLLPFVGDGRFAVSHSLLARWPGRQPVTLWTRVDYRMIDGRQGRLYLEPLAATMPGSAPTLPTAGPLLTPEAPTPTATPTPDVPAASATPTLSGPPRSRLLLPLLSR